jgi:hypothetical protein
MKVLLFVLVYFSSIHLFAATPPEAGTYVCVEGNNDSICDQEIQVRVVQGQATLFQIEYVGWCGGQGPYRYGCMNNECTDGAIKVTFISKNKYHWENLTYGFSCTFEKN